MKGSLALLAGLCASLALSLAMRTGASKPEAALVSLAGQDSRILEPEFARITDAQTWAELWARHTGSEVEAVQSYYNSTGFPTVDFERCMVLAVFRGGATNNAGVSLASVAEEGDVLRVQISDRWFQTAGPDGGAQATTPYGLFILPKSDKAILFLRETRSLKNAPVEWKEVKRLPPISN